jgi:hypothetical protein
MTFDLQTPHRLYVGGSKDSTLKAPNRSKAGCKIIRSTGIKLAGAGSLAQACLAQNHSLHRPEVGGDKCGISGISFRRCPQMKKYG